MILSVPLPRGCGWLYYKKKFLLRSWEWTYKTNPRNFKTYTRRPFRTTLIAMGWCQFCWLETRSYLKVRYWYGFCLKIMKVEQTWFLTTGCKNWRWGGLSRTLQVNLLVLFIHPKVWIRRVWKNRRRLNKIQWRLFLRWRRKLLVLMFWGMKYLWLILWSILFLNGFMF